MKHNLDAIAQAIEERDDALLKYHQLATEMIYNGNSISWIHSKARNYGDALTAAWTELKAAGIECTGSKSVAEGIKELASRSNSALDRNKSAQSTGHGLVL
jgi:hypothetical protein